MTAGQAGSRSPEMQALDEAYGRFIVKYGAPQLLPPPRFTFDFAWDAAGAYFWQAAAKIAEWHEDHDNSSHDCGATLAEEFSRLASLSEAKAPTPLPPAKETQP